MAWSADFIAMTNEQRIQELATINDTLRILRRATIDAQTAATVIEQSTQPFPSGWQGTLVTDIDAGTGGQTPGLTALAEALEALFI